MVVRIRDNNRGLTVLGLPPLPPPGKRPNEAPLDLVFAAARAVYYLHDHETDS